MATKKKTIHAAPTAPKVAAAKVQSDPLSVIPCCAPEGDYAIREKLREIIKESVAKMTPNSTQQVARFIDCLQKVDGDADGCSEAERLIVYLVDYHYRQEYGLTVAPALCTRFDPPTVA
jgi:hypothetical protein